MDAVPSVLLATAAVAAVLAAVAGLAAAVARAPAVAHKAWLLVLLKLVTPPLVVLPVVWPAAAPVADEPPAPPAGPIEPAATDPAPTPDGWDEPGPARAAAPEPQTRAPSAPAPDLPAPAAEVPPAPFPWRTALVVGWLAGAAVYWLLVARRVVAFRRVLRYAAAAPADVATAVRETAARLGLRRVPAVLVVDAAVSPLVWAGFGRPRLVLPRRLWAGLPPDQREAVLAHELAHLRRGDHWVRRLELLALGLYWWFPVAWLACRRLRDAEEACCDAWVVWALPERATAYAEALLETVAFVSRPGWVPLTSGGAARADALKRRLTMILSNTPAPASRRPVAVGLLAAGLLILPVRPGLAEDPKPKPEPQPLGDPADVVVFKYPEDPIKPAASPAVTAVRISQTDALARSAAAPADVSRLRDDLELLEAQGATKAAQVKAAEVAVRAAERRLALVKGQAGQGVVPMFELAAVQSEAENAHAQLEIRQAELKEHFVRVKQAKRRLDDFHRPATATATTADPLIRGAADQAAQLAANKARRDRAEEADRRAAADAARKDGDMMAREMAQLAEELNRAKVMADQLARQRDSLARQLEEVTKQQDAIRAKMAKMADVLDDMKKRYPDRGDPRKE